MEAAGPLYSPRPLPRPRPPHRRRPGSPPGPPAPPEDRHKHVRSVGLLPSVELSSPTEPLISEMKDLFLE